MPQMLKRLSDGMKKAGEAVGHVVSPIVLTLFYFILLPLFAFIHQVGRLIEREDPATSFKPPLKQYRSLEDFKNEY